MINNRGYSYRVLAGADGITHPIMKVYILQIAIDA